MKAENVFIAGPNLVKVGDFGFSTISTKDSALNTFCGSPPYAAPELFKDEHYVGVYVDVWAMGILLYFMVTGVMPFRAETVGKLKKCILNGTYYLPEFLSDSCRFLIRNILRPIPTDRCTIEDIKRSSWLEGQVYPEPDGKYNLRPPVSFQLCSSDEECESLKILHEFGIPSDKLAKCGDSRDSTTGTYRIVLHRIQKRKTEYARKTSSLTQNSNKVNVDSNGDCHRPQAQHKSKFCTIL